MDMEGTMGGMETVDTILVIAAAATVRAAWVHQREHSLRTPWTILRGAAWMTQMAGGQGNYHTHNKSWMMPFKKVVAVVEVVGEISRIRIIHTHLIFKGISRLRHCNILRLLSSNSFRSNSSSNNSYNVKFMLRTCHRQHLRLIRMPYPTTPRHSSSSNSNHYPN
jgi:hypothetical protein